MQIPSPQLLRSLSLASAGLASALALLVLGASTPRLAAQSYTFDARSDSAWTHYDLGTTVTDPPGQYPANIYSFPTNPAGPAGNYAYRIQVPVYTNDPFYYLYPRGGSFLTGANYGNVNDSTFGRFIVGADLIAWNTTWSDMEIGVAWDASIPDLYQPNAYLAGWGPSIQTLGCAKIIAGTTIGLIGLVDPGSTVLQTNRQYRMVASSHDGVTFLIQMFDLAQPNTPWQSVITADNSLGNGGGTVGILGADLLQITPSNTEGSDSTWDNFSVSAPGFVDPSGNVPAIMPATVTDTYPPPAGQVTELYPTVKIGFLNRDTGVNTSNPNWIKLYLDGVQIPNNQLTIDPTNVWKIHNNDEYGHQYGPPDPVATNFPGATITYSIGVVFPRGSLHTNTVVFEDDQTVNGDNVLHTNTWTWTTAHAIPSLALYATNGSLSVTGFDARLVQSLAAHIGGNLVNGNFTANIASFQVWPGYAGGANGNCPGLSNAGDIPNWTNCAGGMNTKGLNGAGTGTGCSSWQLVDSPFAPANSAGYTFLFIQGGGGNALGQYLTGLAPGATYQLSYDACSRAGNTGVWQVIVASDFSSPPASVLYDSGAVVGSVSAFQHVVASFTTPATLTGTENIQLLNVSGAGDNTVDFANVSVTASAQDVLNYKYAVDLAATNLVQAVAYGLAGTEYGAVANFPGLCRMPAGGATPQGNSFAVEAFAYLQLPQGLNSFSVYSDDAVGIYSGTNLADKSIVLLETTAASTSPYTFACVAPQSGLYPIHILYEQSMGPAYLVLNSVTASATNLVNGVGAPQAFYPLVCLSSTNAAKGYTIDAAANAGNLLTKTAGGCTGTDLTVTGGTITVPLSGSPKYYRLNGIRKTQFTGPITKSVVGSVTYLHIPYKTY